jgi:hypothetical protein
MELVIQGVTPYAAAQRAGIKHNTMYRSRLYKLWRDGDTAAFEEAMNKERERSSHKRRPKKRDRFIHVTPIT